MIGAAALGAAVYVLRTPALRRVVWGARAQRAHRGSCPRGCWPRRGSGWAETVPAAIDRPRYDRRVSAPSCASDIAAWRPATHIARPADDQPTPRPHSRPASSAARSSASASEIRLTALAIWRGVVGVYNSDDLTFAASIAYYSLLSLFPFFLLLLSLIASVTSSDADRQAVLDFVLRYFPRQFEFVTSQLEAMQAARVPARRRRQHPDDLGGDGRVRRDHVGGQPRLGRREAAELLQAQDDLVRRCW